MTEKRKSFLIKAAATAFICFHLFAIAVAPNSNTYLASRAAFFFVPYVNFLGLASQWGFFAPDPGPPPVYIEYEFLGDGGDTIGAGTMPRKNDGRWIHEFQNRSLSLVRFCAFDENRIAKIIAPHLCKKGNGAKSVRVWRVIENVPNMESVAQGKRKIGDGRVEDRKWIGQFLCDS